MINHTETVVRDTYQELLVYFPYHCPCMICEEDVLCLALNDLPPVYTTTAMGHAYAKLSEMQTEFKVRVVQAVSKALEAVHNNPRHEFSLP